MSASLEDADLKHLTNLQDMIMRILSWTILGLSACAIPYATYLGVILHRGLRGKHWQRRKPVFVRLLFWLFVSAIILQLGVCLITARILIIPLSFYLFFILPEWNGILFVLVTRMWLLYFAHEYNSALRQQVWQRMLNEKTAENNWFLQNKQKWGRTRSLLPYVVFPTILIGAIFVLFRTLGSHVTAVIPTNRNVMSIIAWSVQSIYLALVVIAIIILNGKLKEVDDNFYIKEEMDEIMVLGIFFFLAMAGIFGMSFIRGPYSVFAIPCYVFVCLVVEMISLYIMIHRVEIKNSFTQTTLLSGKPRLSGDDIQLMIESISWKEVISTQKGYEAFINFQVKELSVENLLYFTEVTQLRSQIIPMLNAMSTDGLLSPTSVGSSSSNNGGMNQSMKYLASASVSTSVSASMSVAQKLAARVEEDHIELDFVPKAQTLIDTDTMGIAMVNVYKKYVEESSAPFEVNVSANTRRKLKELFEEFVVNGGLMTKEQEEEGMMLFDNSLHDIEHLLRDSFTRFKETDEFANYVVWLQKEKKRTMSSTVGRRSTSKA